MTTRILAVVCGLAMCTSAFAQTTPSKPDLKQDLKHAGDQIKKDVKQAKDDVKKAAQDAAKPGEPAMSPADAKMMEAMMKAGTPGPEHAKMAEHEGSWNVTGTWKMTETSPAMPMSGTAKMTMTMGGRVMEEIFRSSDNGMEMEGHGYFSYNNTAKRYESVWMDSGSTGMMFMTGTRGADGVLTTHGECADPASGELKKCKMVEKSTKDSIHLEMWQVGSGGKEWKCMEMDYTRAPNNGLEVKTIDVKPIQAKPVEHK